MGRIIVIANQKGGVGKTSITFHLAGAFIQEGLRVLLVDMDAQGNLSGTLLPKIYDTKLLTVRDLLLERAELDQIIKPTAIGGLSIIPSNLSFGTIDTQLAGDHDAQYLLADKTVRLKDDYDFILIDTPPSLGLPTRLSLVAADEVIIPTECQEYSVIGTKHMRAAIEKVKHRSNPDLKFLGFIISKLDRRTVIEKSYYERLLEQYSDLIIGPPIKKSIEYVKAVDARLPIGFFSPQSEHAQDMSAIAREIQNGRN